MRNRLGISPVVSSIILSAALLVIGGTLWSYANSASQVLADDYIEDTLRLIEEITERFVIEHVANNTDCSMLNITLYNYGSVNVTLDIYVSIEGTQYTSNFSNPLEIPEGERRSIIIAVNGEKGDLMGIQAYSRRQNSAYYSYVVK